MITSVVSYIINQVFAIFIANNFHYYAVSAMVCVIRKCNRI